jgi:ATP-binding cassette subfamily B protein
MKEIWKFLYPTIKPYKWWYILMMQAPVVGAFYNVANMYSLKLVVDAFGKSAVPKYSELLYPIGLYIGAILVLELVWRVSQFAWMKSQPFVRTDLTAKAYDYVQRHSYQFFQNTHSGAISSKIKGIVTGYNNLWFGVHHNITNPLLQVLVVLFSLAFINVQLFIFMALWCSIFFPVMLRISLRITKIATETTDSQHKAMGFIADNISNIFSVFLFTAHSRELKRIDKFLKTEVAPKDYSWIKLELKQSLIGIAFYVSMLFSLFIFMIHLRRTNAVTTGDFVFVMTVTYFLVDNIWKLFEQASDFIGKMGDFKSSFSVINTPQEVIDKKDAKTLTI